MTRNEQIIAAVTAGMTFRQAAAKFGVSRGTVAGVCNRAGVKVGHRPEVVSEVFRKWASENPEYLERMNQGRSKWHRANPDLVRSICRKAGLASAAKRRAA